MRSGKQGERRRKKLVGREREKTEGETEGVQETTEWYGNTVNVKKGRVAENIKITFSVICQINGETN